MKLAVVAGGWHFPAHFYRAIAAQSSGADLFVVAHRNPELQIVREEKCDLLARASGPLAQLDRELYAEFPTVAGLRALGWDYMDAPNTVGDWEFFNQWLMTHDYRDYDVILNCHDDTYMRGDLLGQFRGPRCAFVPESPLLLLANGRYPQAPDAYVRGSFEFWRRELLDMLGGRIDLGEVTLTREGKTDTPTGIAALSAWNATAVPLRRFMANGGLAGRVAYLSPYYRISPWVIEGERGLLSSQDGVPWSFAAGLKEFPLEVAA